MLDNEPRFVALFDIDGTLVTSAGEGLTAGARAIYRAAEEMTGQRPPLPVSEFGGRTDPQIAYLLLEAAGEERPQRARVEELVERYVSHLGELVSEHPYRALGDPTGAVAALASRGGVIGLGTGNVPRGGAIKLASAGIADLFDMRLGGFGDDAESRDALLAKGALRCDPSARLPVIVIGDTPRDIEAAHAIAAPCIGIPYRDNTEERLRAEGADAVIEAIGPELVPVVEALLPR